MKITTGFVILTKYKFDLEDIFVMKRQSAAGLFFSMFLRATVVILGIVILVFGVVLVTKLVKRGDKEKGPMTTVSNNVLTEVEGRDDLLYNSTEAPTSNTTENTTEVEVPETTPAYDKNILVLNSTDVTGLAGRWCETLNEQGYANTSASDYSMALENTKIVAREGGVGEELLNYFNGATYEIGTVSNGTSEPTDGYDIVIIIGIADSNH